MLSRTLLADDETGLVTASLVANVLNTSRVNVVVFSDDPIAVIWRRNFLASVRKYEELFFMLDF